MTMLRPPRSVSLAAAFTLLELLAVIAIISILMGLLFPELIAAKNNARRTQAQQDLQAIVTAVKAYHTEYGKYPPMALDGGQPTSDQGVGDKPNAAMPKDNSTLFDPLRALDRGVNTGPAKNPRRIVFSEGSSVSNPEQPRSGFVDRGSSGNRGSFFAPWGFQYNVVVDSNHDNKVEVGQYYSDMRADESPLTGVVVFSLGIDGKLGAEGNKKARDKNSDDVLSWK